MFKLRNVEIVTEKLKIVNNHLPKGEFKLDPRISRNTGKTNENKYFTSLTLKTENTESSPFPIDILVSLKAVFTLENVEKDDEKDIENFLKLQGVHILYPYMRSTVSSLTSISMLPPIVLPIINAMNMFNDDKKDIEKTYKSEIL